MIETLSVETQTAAEDEKVGLFAVKNLFKTLNSRGIRYCHWKSNLRLSAAIEGRTDLDLLVESQQQQNFKQVLFENGIKRIMAAPGKKYPGLEDYLGLDPETSCQFHLHIHYQLVLGEQFVKNYHIPFETELLHQVHERHGIKVPSPELELIILSMRALLKYRDRDVIKDIFMIRTPGIPAHILEEIDWLLDQTCIEKITRILSEVGEALPGEIVLEFLNTITAAPRDGWTLYRLRTRLRGALRRYLRSPRLWATFIYFRELWRRRNTFLRFFPAKQMTLPDGGLTLALVGVDGAGKTALSRAIVEWLSWKLDVHAYYLGSKQPSWMSSLSYLFFRMARRSHRTLSRRIGEGSLLARIIESVRNSLLYSHYLFTGYDRFRRFLAGRRKAKAGSVVVYDRYPLQAPLDGPQIHLTAEDDNSWSARAFSALEKKLYRRMHLPDLLIVLEVSPEVSFQRKPDHQLETIVEKNKVLERLTTEMEAEGWHIVRIDANQQFETVLSHLKREIWQRLGA